METDRAVAHLSVRASWRQIELDATAARGGATACLIEVQRVLIRT